MEDIINQIEALFDSEIPTSEKNQKVKIGNLSQEVVDFISTSVGLSIDTSFSFTIDKSGINHAIKQHGNDKIELAKGQIAIQKEDFLKIPLILETPDNIEYKGVSKKGLEVFRFIKEFEEEIIVVKEIRIGRREVAFLSMYKLKKK
jgi:hypothetical protein